MKSATLYLRSARFLIHCSSQTTNGVWVLTRPCIALDGGVSDSEVGAAALSALQASRRGVPHPRQDQWRGLFEPMLELAGVKSWKAFVTGAACLDLALEGETVTLTPMRNLGAANGFEPDASRSTTAKAEPEALGRAVRALFGEPSN